MRGFLPLYILKKNEDQGSLDVSQGAFITSEKEVSFIFSSKKTKSLCSSAFSF